MKNSVPFPFYLFGKNRSLHSFYYVEYNYSFVWLCCFGLNAKNPQHYSVSYTVLRITVILVLLLFLDEKIHFTLHRPRIHIGREVLWSTESHPLLFQNKKIIVLLEGSRTASTDCHLKIKYTELVAETILVNFEEFQCAWYTSSCFLKMRIVTSDYLSK